MCQTRSIRREDPHWVFKGYLRALEPGQLLSLEAWQHERKEIGDPAVVADARFRLELIGQELSRRLPSRKRNGHRNSSIEGFGTGSLPAGTVPEPPEA
jgi:hypothetical protein